MLRLFSQEDVEAPGLRHFVPFIMSKISEIHIIFMNP